MTGTVRFLALPILFGMLAWPSAAHAQPPTGIPTAQGQPQPLPMLIPAPLSQPGPSGLADPPPPVVVTGPFSQPGMPAPRFQFTIDPKTSVKDLLPVASKIKLPSGPVLTEDLAQVPEVELQAPLAHTGAAKETAYLLAKINHVSAKRSDAYMEALRGERPDLQGLPFAMGDACRTKGERSKQFAIAVELVRSSLRPRPLPPPSALQPPPPPPAPSSSFRSSSTAPTDSSVFEVSAVPFIEEGPLAGDFWVRYDANTSQLDREASRTDRDLREHITVARIAALMQVLAPESPGLRLGLVRHLSTISHVEATRALAKLAIFSTETEIRQAAIDALKVRRERDYTEVLVAGLRYPWPAVAKRAGEAIVKLERNDLIPQLVAVLDEPDPRAPVTCEIEKKKVTVVREMVKINHHRNCILCHAPGNTNTIGAETLTAGVAIPGEPLPSPQEGYRNSVPDILVRLDVTYLRQDFSVMQPVADAAPWPEMQRFDFLVRTRVLTDAEAVGYREKFENREEGRFPPHQRAALAALRDLTGRDTAPTAEAWRKMLKLPSRTE